MMPRFAISLSMAAVLAVVAIVVSDTMLAGAQGQVRATGNVAVRDGRQPGEVIISWEVVPEATHYRIGYVNMETDYPLAKASNTGNWLEAFVYVDVEAQNFPVVGGRTEYTMRRLAQGVRHAFTVRTGGDIDGAFTWPSNPRWRFHVVADRGGASPAAPPSAGTISDLTPTTPAGECRVGQRFLSGQGCRFVVHQSNSRIFHVINGGPYHGWGQMWGQHSIRFFAGGGAGQNGTINGVAHRFAVRQQGSAWVVEEYGIR